MYKPKFKYTHEIVDKSVKISAAREVVLNSPLVPKWEISLRRDAIIRSAHASTSIEGDNLSLEQVSELAKGRDIMAKRKDKTEVLNYLKALEKINTLTDGKIITEDNILKIQEMLTTGTLEDPKDCGAFRWTNGKYVVVGNRQTGEVTFRPPQNDIAPKMMGEYVEWLNSKQSAKLDPVIAAGAAHYEFVRIHPFMDGNGRTSRVIAALILYQRGFDTKQFFCLDDYYDSDRNEYYKALRTVNPKKLDLTKWLEYFVDGVAVSITAIREQVAKLSSERLRAKKKGQIALTERQMRIVEFINQNGKINTGDITGMFKITRQAALKEIGKLSETGIIKMKGKARASYYVMI